MEGWESGGGGGLKTWEDSTGDTFCLNGREKSTQTDR